MLVPQTALLSKSMPPHGRLDLDWRWIAYCMEKGVMLSINPDAHAMEGYLDMHYGVS
jgi:histidinol phosphatase-like PHP family hydrolase